MQPPRQQIDHRWRALITVCFAAGLLALVLGLVLTGSGSSAAHHCSRPVVALHTVPTGDGRRRHCHRHTTTTPVELTFTITRPMPTSMGTSVPIAAPPDRLEGRHLVAARRLLKAGAAPPYRTRLAEREPRSGSFTNSSAQWVTEATPRAILGLVVTDLERLKPLPRRWA